MQNLAIVVPVHNATEDLKRCLASLTRHRPETSTIHLIDDASTDARVRPILRAFAADNPGVRLTEVAENRGFIATVNRGAAEAPPDGDLLLLNTDTEVTEGWVDEMRAAMEATPNSQVCCPLSNNATILSVPRFQQGTPLSFGLDASHMGAVVRASAGDTPAIPIPTPVGYCMFVRRDAWRKWGPFDEAYGKGYGEEDDFGQHVQAGGGVIVCATRAFVYHRGAASFGESPEVAARKRRNGDLLLSRWPEYNNRTRAWCRANPMRPLHERIWKTLLAPRAGDTVHILHVLQAWETSGPIRERMMAVVRATRDFALHTVLVPTPDKGAWLDAIDFEFEQGLRVVGLLNFESSFARFLEANAPTLVHFHGTEWVDPAVLAHAKDARPVLATPADASDPGRAAALYRQAAAGR